MTRAIDRGDGILRASDVWKRYGVCSRTLARWLEAEDVDFPRPILINNRRYFRAQDIEDWERRRAGGKAA